MGHTNVNIRMDEALKQDFSALCGEQGFSMTAAFNVFARTSVRQHRIPIGPATPNAETIAAIDEVRMMKKNPSLGRTYTDVDQMMKELLT